jgi:hypothetical protein
MSLPFQDASWPPGCSRSGEAALATTESASRGVEHAIRRPHSSAAKRAQSDSRPIHRRPIMGGSCHNNGQSSLFPVKPVGTVAYVSSKESVDKGEFRVDPSRGSLGLAAGSGRPPSRPGRRVCGSSRPLRQRREPQVFGFACDSIFSIAWAPFSATPPLRSCAGNGRELQREPARLDAWL